MSKKITIAFDEKTGKFAIDMSGYEIDMSGYEDRECEKDLRQFLKELRGLGIDVSLDDIEFKPPQIPENARIKVRE